MRQRVFNAVLSALIAVSAYQLGWAHWNPFSAEAWQWREMLTIWWLVPLMATMIVGSIVVTVAWWLMHRKLIPPSRQ